MLLLRMGGGAADMPCLEVGAVVVLWAARYRIACHALLRLQHVGAAYGLPGSWSCALGPVWQPVALPAVSGSCSETMFVGPVQCGLLKGVWVRCSSASCMLSPLKTNLWPSGCLPAPCSGLPSPSDMRVILEPRVLACRHLQRATSPPFCMCNIYGIRTASILCSACRRRQAVLLLSALVSPFPASTLSLSSSAQGRPVFQTQLTTSAGTSKGDISTFILAQDLFAMCGEQMRGTYVAAVHAARTFAGEEAHPVALTKFLGQAVPSLDALMVSHAGCKAWFQGHLDIPYILGQAVVLRLLLACYKEVLGWC